MARLLADENFPLPTIDALRSLGHVVITAHEADLANRATPDQEVLEYARSNGLALLTLNRRHFMRLLCSFDPDFERQAQRVHAMIEAEGAPAGKLLRVTRPAV